MKYITHKEASHLLGIEKVGTVRNATMRGVLTKVPTLSQEQLLIREQVLLFKGKNQIRLTMLSENEKKLWAMYKEAVEKAYEDSNRKEKEITPPYNLEELSQKIQELTHVLEGIPQEAWYGLALAGVGAATLGSGVPKGSPFLQKA